MVKLATAVQCCSVNYKKLRNISPLLLIILRRQNDFMYKMLHVVLLYSTYSIVPVRSVGVIWNSNKSNSIWGMKIDFYYINVLIMLVSDVKNSFCKNFIAPSTISNHCSPTPSLSSFLKFSGCQNNVETCIDLIMKIDVLSVYRKFQQKEKLTMKSLPKMYYVNISPYFFKFPMYIW